MLVVAKSIVVLAACFFLLFGVLAFVRPARIHGFLLGFAGSALKHYAELLVRLLIGYSLLLVARESAYTGVLSGFGWLLIITTALMALSGFLLWLAQKEIPIGTSYAIWTGIGAAGTFMVGVLYYGDPSSLGRYLGVALIIAGVATLKLAH